MDLCRLFGTSDQNQILWYVGEVTKTGPLNSSGFTHNSHLFDNIDDNQQNVVC